MAGLPCPAMQSSVLSQRRNLARKGGNGTVASVCAKPARVCWSKRRIAHFLLVSGNRGKASY